ncbi:MAG: hypothetical protein ACK47B_13190 [Armatimonadota bacterium]
MRPRTAWFPCTFLLALAVAAAAAPERDVLAAEPRLQRSLTVTEQDRPLSEVLSGLSRRLGVPLRAGSDVRDDKVTLFLRDRPAAEVLRTLEEALELRWLRSESGFLAAQDPAVTRRERTLTTRLLRACDVWMSRLQQVAALPEADRNRRFRELEEALKDEALAPERRRELSEELDALRDLNRHSRAVPVIIGIYRGLNPAQRSLLGSLGYVRLSTTHGDLPQSMLAAAAEALRAGPHTSPLHVDCSFQIEESDATWESPRAARSVRVFGYLTLVNGVNGQPAGSSMVNWGVRVPQPDPVLPFTPDPAPDPVLDQKIKLDLPDPAAMPAISKIGLTAQVLGRWPGGMVRLSELARQLHQATGLQVAADSFVRARLEPAFLQQEHTVREVLNHLAKELDYTWQKDGTLLLLRARDPLLDRSMEVPERVLRPFRKQLAGQTQLSLDQLSRLALALTDRQLRGMSDYWGWYLQDAGVPAPYGSGELFGFRDALRLWGSLSPSQREAVAAGQTLPVAAMTPSQRRFATRALALPLENPGFPEDFVNIPPVQGLPPHWGGFSLKQEAMLAQCAQDEKGNVTTMFRRDREGPPNLFNLNRFGGGSYTLSGPEIRLDSYRFNFHVGNDRRTVRSLQLYLLPGWER